MKRETLASLEKMCIPIVEYIRDNYSPYAVIHISEEAITVTEDIVGIPLKKTVNQED